MCRAAPRRRACEAALLELDSLRAGAPAPLEEARAASLLEQLMTHQALVPSQAAREQLLLAGCKTLAELLDPDAAMPPGALAFVTARLVAAAAPVAQACFLPALWLLNASSDALLQTPAGAAAWLDAAEAAQQLVLSSSEGVPTLGAACRAFRPCGSFVWRLARAAGMAEPVADRAGAEAARRARAAFQTLVEAGAAAFATCWNVALHHAGGVVGSSQLFDSEYFMRAHTAWQSCGA